MRKIGFLFERISLGHLLSIPCKSSIVSYYLKILDWSRIRLKRLAIHSGIQVRFDFSVYFVAFL